MVKVYPWASEGAHAVRPYNPLARAVIGGLAASTVLTLILLPFVYTLLDDAAAVIQ